MSSSSSSRNWVFDVFVSFRGEDVREAFLSHFIKELDRKLISVFKDNKIEKSQSLDPVLKQAIKDSRTAIVIFSQNYGSSSWCLNELLEIVKCRNESGQLVIPVFYRLNPSHVRNQTGDFGNVFKKTCENKTEDEIGLWCKALTDVANLVGFHSKKWKNDAKLIEDLVSDVLKKLNLSPCKDFDNFVGIEDHIAKMSLMLDLKSEEVKTVGIWGPSGIGKTTIARALYSQLSHHFQNKIFIDMRFVSKCKEIYSRSNPDDYNMKLHLQENFLSKILDKEGIEVGHLGVVRGKLMHHKVLIMIDDLDDQVVLDALAGEGEWFGRGSRIIAITKNKHILRAHGIKCIYQVGFPSEKVALQIFCQSAFRQNSPPEGFIKLASEVAERAGGLPLGLNLLGSSMRGRDEKYWVDMLPTLRNCLDEKIDKALRVSYDGLERKEKALFRHIACLFNGYEMDNIKLMLADSELNVDKGLEVLLDKSLIHVIPQTDIVEMHNLVEEMGKEIVCAQSNDPGEREFLIDSKNVVDVLRNSTGTNKVLGISLNINETDELRIDEEAFKVMRNLTFLNIYANTFGPRKETRWHLPEGFNYLSRKLKFLNWEKYPLRYMPSNFQHENLVTLQMCNSNLEKLWEGVHSLTGLKTMDLWGSKNLKKIPDLSMATNLETLGLWGCSSLVELPSSIQYLNKLTDLDMSYCHSLETLPTGINLKSLYRLSLRECPLLKCFPDISTNISDLDLSGTTIEEYPSHLRLKYLDILQMDRMRSEKLWEQVEPLTPLMTWLSPSLTVLSLSDIPSLVELPTSIQNLYKLKKLFITECKNLETLPTGINFQSLWDLTLTGCSRLRSFPNISTNILDLNLAETGIEEVPWWIEDFSRLRYLYMGNCNSLQRISVNICKLKNLANANFPNCGALTEARMNDSANAVAMAVENIHFELQVLDEDSYCYPYHVPKLHLNFRNSFNFDPKALLEQQSVLMEIAVPGEEVPSYFTHRISGTSSPLTNIPMPHTYPSQPFIRIRTCFVVDYSGTIVPYIAFQLFCRFKERLGNHFDSTYKKDCFWIDHKVSHMFIVDCLVPLNRDGYPTAEEIFETVDVEFRLIGGCILKGWGIRLFDVCETYRFEGSGESDDSDIGNETDQSEEYEYSDDSDIVSEADDSEADQSEEYGESEDGYIDSETDQSQDCEDSEYGDTSYETDDSGESGDSHTETKRSSKRRRIT